ncbi:MAG: hypothetical protein JNJ70_14090 [Verrucomicrobiales bacterium]|nr:hypothetical protein [Verrucomicrobiales bacterium]
MKTILFLFTALLAAPIATHAGVQYSVVANMAEADAKFPRGPWTFFGGQFYGASQMGGNNTHGTIYRFDPNAGSVTLLHTFTGGNQGTGTSNGIIRASNGFLYGVNYGGSNGAGTLFRIDSAGNNFSTVYSFFTLSGGNANAAPIEGNDGKLYGVTSTGGFFSNGGIFRIDPDGSNHQLLRAFSGTAGITPGRGGSSGGIIEAPDGLIYGTTNSGGVADKGVVYQFDKSASPYPYTVLHEFTNTSIRSPSNTPLLASDDLLYGAATEGGRGGQGGIYRIARNGTGFQVLHEFDDNLDGYGAYSAFIEGSDGYVYGVAFFSSNNFGSVFRFRKDGGSFAVLHRFAGSPADGAQPDSPLIETAPGVFYGTTNSSGANLFGTIFRLETTLEPPTLEVTGRKSVKFRGNRLVLRGTALDDLEVNRVEYLGTKRIKEAVGTNVWTARVRVKKTQSRVRVTLRAVDNDGLLSPPTVIRGKRAS